MSTGLVLYLGFVLHLVYGFVFGLGFSICIWFCIWVHRPRLKHLCRPINGFMDPRLRTPCIGYTVCCKFTCTSRVSSGAGCSFIFPRFHTAQCQSITGVCPQIVKSSNCNYRKIVAAAPSCIR